MRSNAPTDPHDTLSCDRTKPTFWLPRLDSNQQLTGQNLLCYQLHHGVEGEGGQDSNWWHEVHFDPFTTRLRLRRALFRPEAARS